MVTKKVGEQDGRVGRVFGDKLVDQFDKKSLQGKPRNGRSCSRDGALMNVWDKFDEAIEPLYQPIETRCSIKENALQ